MDEQPAPLAERPDFISSADVRKRSLPSIALPLLVLVLAAVGNIITVRAASTQSPHLILIALNQVFSVALWVGAVWLGALLAYRGIVSWRS